MLEIILTVFFFAVSAYAVWNYYLVPQMKKQPKNTRENKNWMYIIIAAAAAFVLRIILAAAYKGHSTDMSCFIGWSESVFKNGMGAFYKSNEFHDYPPGYMYVLYVIGALRSVIPLSGAPLYVLIKLPAILCDIAAALIIYRMAEKKFTEGVSTALAALYLFNPAVILNSSIWGQVDAVYTLLILVMVYMMVEKKMIYSYFAFAICIMIKPQAFILTPLLVAGIVENVFLHDFSREKFLKNLVAGLGSLAAMFLLSLPFGIKSVFEQYTSTIASYPYHTVNAFNFWGAIGKNWAGLITISNILGVLFTIAIVAFSIYLFVKSKNSSKYYFVGAVLVFLTYMFSTRMHERYAFASMILLLAALVTTENVHSFIMYTAVSLSQLLNAAWVLFVYEKDASANARSVSIIYASIANLILAGYIIYQARKLYAHNYLAVYTENKEPPKKSTKSYNPKKNNKPKRKSNNRINTNIQNQDNTELETTTEQTKNRKKFKITRVDLIAMAVITVVYSGVALFDLGDMHAPETECDIASNSVTLDLGDEYIVDNVKFYLGSYELNQTRTLSVVAKDKNGKTTLSDNISEGSVFYWNDEPIEDKARYITFASTSDHLTIREIAITDYYGNIVTPVSASNDGGYALFDEQDEIPDRVTFRNSTYFDEIYHARTGYEFLHSQTVYEWTHPPLGKVFIALGIKIFGMNPFGWRIIGTIFGILMIPLIYLFAKRLLKKTWLAIVTCLLLTFDFMHFAQTRIATIDVYVTFFIIMMFYFMYQYYKSDIDTEHPYKNDFISLALCGCATGLAIASKVTGVYAAVFGLLPLWIIAFCQKYRKYKNINADKTMSDTRGVYTLKTMLWCVLFFVVIPLGIYCLSYIPFLRAPDANGFKSIIENQFDMLRYHGKTVLNSTHPFSSKWYEWILMKRPIWYYSGTISETVKEGISSFGNPLVWWAGVPAFVYMLYLCIAKKDKKALFLVIAYAAQLLPWALVPRLTFIYHYFPCVPFIVLMIGYSISKLYDKARNKKHFFAAVCVYVMLVILLFVMFYPVLSGQPCRVDYVNNFLKWFDSWVLI